MFELTKESVKTDKKMNPPQNFGMKSLDRSLFKKTVNMLALKVPAAKCGPLMSCLRKYVSSNHRPFGLRHL